MWKLNYYIAKIMILIVFCNGGVGASYLWCTYRNKYDVLTDVSTRTYFSEYTHLLSRVRRTYYRRQLQVETVARSQKGQVKLVLLWGFAECGNRKALRLKAQGVYLCKWPSLNVDNNTASAVLCNGLKWVKQDIPTLIASEIERIKNDPNLKGLIKESLY